MFPSCYGCLDLHTKGGVCFSSLHLCWPQSIHGSKHLCTFPFDTCKLCATRSKYQPASTSLPCRRIHAEDCKPILAAHSSPSTNVIAFKALCAYQLSPLLSPQVYSKQLLAFTFPLHLQVQSSRSSWHAPVSYPLPFSPPPLRTHRCNLRVEGTMYLPAAARRAVCALFPRQLAPRVLGRAGRHPALGAQCLLHRCGPLCCSDAFPMEKYGITLNI